MPACPDWTVRDLFSHMVGLGGDVVAGDEPDDHNEAWTERQVGSAAGATSPRWWPSGRRPRRRCSEWMREHGTRPLSDVTIHEQDLRGALGGRAPRTPAGWRRCGTGSSRGSGPAGRPAADRPGGHGSWQWVSAGTVDDAAVVLRASDFDLARAVVSRRSAGQLRSWTSAVTSGPTCGVRRPRRPAGAGPHRVLTRVSAGHPARVADAFPVITARRRSRARRAGTGPGGPQ